MSPSEYAARYLPVTVPGNGQPLPIHISRYHLGQETAAKDRLLGALTDHFITKKRKDPGYRLTLTVNGSPLSIADRKEISLHLYRPFIGKGSPEECQIVLQLAVLVGGITPGQLQGWADANLGLDCNGFVGNYLFYDVMGNDWQTEVPQGKPGPSALIDTIFHWASWSDESGVVDDLDRVQPNFRYLIARVDAGGTVMPGGPGHPVGHIAITEPGQIMRQSFVHDSMGGIDPGFVKLDMYNHLALRTVESVGPRNGDPGIGMNWIVFLRKNTSNGKVFEVRRDKIHMLDTVKIAPIRAA